MTLRDLNLLAGLAALTTLGVVGCADSPAPDQGFAPSAAPSGYTAPVDPATSTSPPEPALPDAPPEIPSDGVNSPSEQIDPDDPDERPPGWPPPTLPDRSPG
jgi:hypothetical protein